MENKCIAHDNMSTGVGALHTPRPVSGDNKNHIYNKYKRENNKKLRQRNRKYFAFTNSGIPTSKEKGKTIL